MTTANIVYLGKAVQLHVQRLPSIFIRTIFCRMSSSTLQNKPVEISIREKLNNSFKPTYLDVINESHMHNVPKGKHINVYPSGAETHFKVCIVSDVFANQPLIKRHQLVHEVLKNELKGGVHALSIETKTPEQWNEMISSGKPLSSPSPPCKGGFGK